MGTPYPHSTGIMGTRILIVPVEWDPRIPKSPIKWGSLSENGDPTHQQRNSIGDHQALSSEALLQLYWLQSVREILYCMIDREYNALILLIVK